VVRVPAGEALSDAQRARLARVVQEAEEATGLRFRVVVGELGSSHTLLSPPDAQSVLVAVDPADRQLHIVTGSRAATQISDRVCGLASLAMTSSFAAGDLVGGLRNGIQVLADHGRREDRRHLDTL
jgi:hypothetical protein